MPSLAAAASSPPVRCLSRTATVACRGPRPRTAARAEQAVAPPPRISTRAGGAPASGPVGVVPMPGAVAEHDRVGRAHIHGEGLDVVEQAEHDPLEWHGEGQAGPVWPAFGHESG